MLLLWFLFNETATTEIYTLSLHDALPISRPLAATRRLAAVVRGGLVRAAAEALRPSPGPGAGAGAPPRREDRGRDRKSTRLNSSHANISYAVFCLKKKHTTSGR